MEYSSLFILLSVAVYIFHNQDSVISSMNSTILQCINCFLFLNNLMKNQLKFGNIIKNITVISSVINIQGH